MRIYDQRDTLLSRSRLEPGTREYQRYYQEHPELEERDKKIRIFYNPGLVHQQRLKNFPTERRTEAFMRRSRTLIPELLKHAVDGEVSKEKIEVDAAEMSRIIKDFARYLGAGMVGITELNPAWVYSHSGERDDWGQPISQQQKYAIVMAFPHNWDLWLTSARPGIPFAIDTWHDYSLMAAAAVRLAAAIRDMGYPARAQIVSNYTCVLPPLAVDAGLGEQCLIGVCSTKEYGLAFRLCAVTTDLPLVPDERTNLGMEDFCRKCHKCVAACPAGALSRVDKVEVNGRRVWKQEAYKCFRYWNAIGVGCNACRRVCPWSKPRTVWHRGVANIAVNMPPLNRFLIWADRVIYGEKARFYPGPGWLQDEKPQLDLARRFAYWFDHI